MTQGLWLYDLRLRLSTADEGYSTELTGSKWGYEDQNFGLTAGRVGVWQFYFEWDQTPHVYSTNSRMLAVETDRGVFRLPTPRPALRLYNTAPEIDEISTRWDTARMGATFSISPNSEVTADYTRIHKHGDKPFSLAFGGPGNNFLEVLEPVDHTIHDFRLKYSLARENFQIQIGYGLSVFKNEFDRVIADNPCFANAAACGGNDGGAAAPRFGTISLPPDNQAHSLNIAAGVNLPMRTRLTANLNYSLRLQNDTFLPHTSNPALAANPDLRLPQDSLNGNVQTVLINLMATSRPLPKLTLFGKYRYYDMFDVSDTIHFNKVAQNDRSITTAARRAGRWDYSKQNAEVGARYALLPSVTVGTAVGWERWDRNFHREVEDSDEFFAKATVDVTPFDWLLVRGTYRPSFRRIAGYNTRAHTDHTVDEDAAAANQGQSVLLRKFDEGERNEQRFDVFVQLTPLEGLTITPNGSYRYDDYINSKLGLQEETSYSLGIDLTWSPHERFAFSIGYVHDHTDQKMRSRSRPVTGTTTFDFKDFEWVSNIRDTYDTIYAGVKIVVIPRVLEWSAGVNYATSLGRLNTNNPVVPASGTAAQDASATAFPFPATEDQLIRLDAALRYHFWKSWTATFGYAFESFQKNDWRTDRLMPFQPGVTSIWLGDDDRNYTAHIVGLRLGYRF
jgi:MtrB/PioB family decaheme-associated outer membrane protein